MADKKRREFFLGLIMLLVGLAYLWATMQVPRKSEGIDASFVPTILGSLCSFLGVLQLLGAAKLQAAAAKASSVDYDTVGKTLALIVCYVALLNWVGFPIMTVAYLLAQFYVLTPADQKPRWLLYAAVAVVTSGGVYLLFHNAFDLMLPLGPLDFAQR